MFWLVQFILGACCLIGGSYAKNEAEVKEYFIKLGLQCNQENPVSPDDMVKLHEYKIPDNENAKCLLACVYKRAGWMNDKGTFDVAAAIAFSDKEHSDDADKAEKSKKVFEACKNVNEESPSDGEKGCDRAAMLTRCLVDTSPKMGLSIVM